MSYVFEIDGVTVWSPALRVGRVFVGCAQALAEVVGLPLGFSFNGTDMIEIDCAELEAFVGAMAQISEPAITHRILNTLVHPVAVPCVVMLRRSGRNVPFGSDPKTLALIDEIDATMPR